MVGRDGRDELADGVSEMSLKESKEGKDDVGDAWIKRLAGTSKVSEAQERRVK